MDQRDPATGQMTRASANKARRPRAARACDACRLKKNKCDELLPCTYCRNRKIECVYKGQSASSGRCALDYVRQLEEHVKRLSSLLEPQDTAQSPAECATTHPSTSAGVGINASQVPLSQDPPMSEMDNMCEPGITDADTISPRGSTSRGSTSTRLAGEQEVSGVNRHTRNVEFYGSSSSVALLSHIQRSSRQDNLGAGAADAAALVTSLHNPAFHSPDHHGQRDPPCRQAPHPRHFSHCRGFLDSYFSAIHYIHPILDKHQFLQRCETLWSGTENGSVLSSFVPLYYSVLSLGALIGVRDDEPIDGIKNLQWSRRFFEIAKDHCNQLGMVTDLDMVQCYFLLAKVCQNELSSHLSYMYVGLAVRTALAIGINREPRPDSGADPALLKAESRTWWGLYSLETEMSFAMGRPDTLGADLYHNRQFPVIKGATDADSSRPELLDAPHCAIIKCMVDFSRITRTICLGIYLSETKVPRTVAMMNQIEQDLVRWIESLPEAIRPNPLVGSSSSLRSAKDPQWVKRQKLVLNIRYHNLRILLFGSLLLKSSATERALIPGSREATQKYLDSASKTIDIIYQVYEHNDFFRTWFYNTTYTVFAASIILVYVIREATEKESQPLLKRVGMAIEILEIMDECVVALEAAKLLRRGKEKAEGTRPSTPETTLNGFDAPMLLNHFWGPLDLLDGDMDLDFAFQLAEMDLPASTLLPPGLP